MTNRYAPGVLVVAALVAAAVVVLLGEADEEAEQSTITEPTAVVVTGTPDIRFELLTSGRAELSVCVDAGHAAPTGNTVEVVRNALRSALSAASIDAEATIVSGCPYPALLSAVLAGETFDYLERNSARSRAQFVGDERGPPALSTHVAFVYVVGADVYSRAFGSESYVSTGEEFVCDGICHAATRGLYVPAGADEETLKDGFMEVLNLLNEQQLRELLEEKLDSPAQAPAE